MSQTTTPSGRITDAAIEKMRMRIGYRTPYDFMWNTEATTDALRHFAHGYGDDNPLFCDPEYGAESRWESQIAPPMFFQTVGHNTAPQMPDEVRKASRGALRGVHQFYSGAEFRFFRPIRLGDRLNYNGVMSDITPKESSFGGGRSVLTHNELTYRNQDGEVVTWEHHWFVHTERETAKKAGKLKDVPKTEYTDEDLAEIDAAYETEFRRGAAPLYFEDVEVGMPLPGVVKGPLTVTDLICMHMGWGWGGYNVGALRLGYLNRKRIPAFYTKNDVGAWDVMQRVHWDEGLAREVGVPYRYDYGFMRMCWLAHALTNFVGDNGWLSYLWNELRGFNYQGDTTWVRGEVTGKREDTTGNVVEIELWCDNQRGERTVNARAEVLLPTRTQPVRLPDAPAGLGDVEPVAP